MVFKKHDARGNLIFGGRKNSFNTNGNPSGNNGNNNTQNTKPRLENFRLYTAREHEPELDLYYYRSRYYDAKIGKFTSRDPLLYVDGPNPYSYVNNNPVNFVDPWGLEKRLINDYVYTMFSESRKEIEGNFFKAQTLMKFGKNFNEGGKRNVKQTLPKEYVDKNGNISINGVEISPSDLGNTLYGYLAHVGGIYNTAAKKAYDIEYKNYEQYYGKEYGKIRAELDENVDRYWYLAGKDIAELNLENNKNAFLNNLSKNLEYAQLSSKDAIIEEEKGIIDICEKTIGINTKFESSLCKEKILWYYTKQPGEYSTTIGGVLLFQSK